MKGQRGAYRCASNCSVSTGTLVTACINRYSIKYLSKHITLSSRCFSRVSLAPEWSLTLVKNCRCQRTTCLNEERRSRDKVHPYRDDQMIQKLYEWSKAYGGKAVVPKSVHDGQELGSWLRKVRKLKEGMTPEDVERLDRAGIVWEMNVLESKWFSNFHLVREYIECHPGCDVDLEMTSEFDHPDRSDWVEASRWLVRQKELYRKQKLTNMKVRLLKSVLGT